MRPARRMRTCPSVSTQPVGEIELPGLVRLSAVEPDRGRSRTLARLGSDESRASQDSVDRRVRRHGQGLALEVPSDRDGPGVQSAGSALDAKPHAAIDDLWRCRSRVSLRSPRPRIDGVETAGPTPGRKPAQMPARRPLTRVLWPAVTAKGSARSAHTPEVLSCGPATDTGHGRSPPGAFFVFWRRKSATTHGWENRGLP